MNLKIRSAFFSFIFVTSVLTLVYIIAVAVFLKPLKSFDMPAYVFVSVILGFTFLALGVYKLSSGYGCIRMNRGAYIVFLIIIAVAPRLIWVLMVDTKPVSDYFLYHTYATAASNGVFDRYDPTYPVFPFKFGYPLILAVVYKIFGSSLLVAKIFNVASSACIATMIYWMGTKAFNEAAGRTAGIIFSLWPAQIMYNSVLAAEHIFMVFFVLSVALFVKLQDFMEDKKAYGLCLALGIVLTLAQFVRPISLLLFPAFLIYLFVFRRSEKPLSKSLLNKTGVFTLILLGYAVSLAILNTAVSNLVKVPIWKSSSGYNILVGTNYESSGMYNKTDEKIVREFNYDFDKIHREAAKRAIGRIKSQPVEFLRLIKKKFIIQWGDEEYGFYWSTVDFTNTTPLDQKLRNSSREFNMISQTFYVFILLGAVSGCIRSYRAQSFIPAVFVLIFLGFAAAYTLFEVQSRYHYPAIPFLIILAGFGMEKYKSGVAKPRLKAGMTNEEK